MCHQLKTTGIYIESDKNPDFTVSHNKTNNKFYIECKYRSNISKNNNGDEFISWATKEQILRYNTISKKDNIPVYIIIGLQGMPIKPDYIFCIPLKDCNYPDMYLTKLNRFIRIPISKPFMLNNGEIK